MKNKHRDYDPQVEDQKEKQYQMMRDVCPPPGQAIIDEWSRQKLESIKTPGDFDEWVFGMIQLYRAQSGDK